VKQADSKLPAVQPEDRRRSIALKMMVISRQYRIKFDQGVEQHGVTRAKWTLIAAVARNPGTTQRAIAAMLEVTEVTAGRLIDRLCSDGYLERRENPVDRRGYCVYLTPAAQPVMDKMSEVAKIHEDETFANVSDDDLEKLDTLLSAIASNLAIPQHQSEAKNLLENNDGLAD
jgi:MarR family transcriptional regulator, transcriptional regulator for hemolysin